MLDVSVQAQIMTLIRTLQSERKMSLLYISHDLDTVRALCDRVAVMQEGRIVEQGRVDDVFEHPRHPSTKALLDSAL